MTMPTRPSCPPLFFPTVSKHARIPLYVYLLLAILFASISLAYIIAASHQGFHLQQNATGMTAIWANLFATTGWVLFAITLTTPGLDQRRPRYYLAMHVFHGLLLAMLFIGLVAMGCLGDAHGAVWAGLAFVTLSIGWIMEMGRRARAKMGSPIVPLTKIKTPTSSTKIPSSPTTHTQGGGGGREGACPARCQASCTSCSLWISLLFMMLLVLGYGIGAALTAREAVLYPAPGKHYILGTSSTSTTTVKMHLYCTGTRGDPTRPIIVFEHGGGSSSFSFYGVQQELSAAGIRSCAYDRPGFGWAEALPVGEESLETYNHLLKSLLQAANEAPPYILCGHSAGVELAQVFVAHNPSSVVGVSLLDGYPDYLRLMGYTDAQVKKDKARVCGILQVARAFEAVGLIRPIYLARQSFEPAAEERRQASTYTNGHNFDAQWRTYCRSRAPDATAYLSAAATAAQGDRYGENPDHPNVRWPQLPAITQVQIISASSTVLPAGPGGKNNIYMTQAKAYNATLSPTGLAEWLICNPCGHTFPYEKPAYLGAQLVNLYSRV